METKINLATWHNYTERKGAEGHTVEGCLKIFENLYSPQLNNRRDLLVYLPPSYFKRKQRYPVIYMHDGQNLFDEVTSFAGEWHVDSTMETLSGEGVEAIVVGIPNMGPQRLDEYSPFRDVRLNNRRHGDKYLGFIIDTIKPLVDRDFRTRPERAATGILGSSLGGLISLYAFFQYPNTFGFVGALSPSLWFANQAIFDYVREAAFYPGKIYLDIGSLEYAGSDSDWMLALGRRLKPYRGSVRHLRDLLQRKGYRLNRELFYVEEEGAGHQESAWANRLPEALRFLLR